MKFTIYLWMLPLLMVISCDSSNIIQTQLPTSPIEQPASTIGETTPASPDSAETPQRLMALSKADIALMKEHSSSLGDSIKIAFEQIHKGLYSTIPKEFLQKYIYQLPISVPHADAIKQEAYEAHYFHAFREDNALLVFTIIQVNEYCCLSVYGISVDKTTGRILDAAMLALSGGDGGWGRSDAGHWQNDSTLIVTKIELELESSGEQMETYAKDSVIRQFVYSQRGYWSNSVLDSIHSTDSVYYQ